MKGEGKMGKKIVLLSIALCCMPIQANAEALLGWEKHIIGQQDKSIYLYVKDIDGDGDLDVASTTNDHPNFYESEVAWFRNNMQQELPWEKFIISSRTPLENAITNSNGIVVADIDGDGHEDVAVGTGRVMVDIGSVYFVENIGIEDAFNKSARIDITINGYITAIGLLAWDDIEGAGDWGANLWG